MSDRKTYRTICVCCKRSLGELTEDDWVGAQRSGYCPTCSELVKSDSDFPKLPLRERQKRRIKVEADEWAMKSNMSKSNVGHPGVWLTKK